MKAANSSLRTDPASADPDFVRDIDEATLGDSLGA